MPAVDFGFTIQYISALVLMWMFWNFSLLECCAQSQRTCDNKKPPRQQNDFTLEHYFEEWRFLQTKHASRMLFVSAAASAIR